jgi:hypothetical protein
MVLYFQSNISARPIIFKTFLKIILFLTIGNTTIKLFQYEKFYDIESNQIIYTRYYITLPDSKIEKNLKEKSILFKPVETFCSNI